MYPLARFSIVPLKCLSFNFNRDIKNSSSLSGRLNCYKKNQDMSSSVTVQFWCQPSNHNKSETNLNSNFIVEKAFIVVSWLWRYYPPPCWPVPFPCPWTLGYPRRPSAPTGTSSALLISLMFHGFYAVYVFVSLWNEWGHIKFTIISQSCLLYRHENLHCRFKLNILFWEK